MMIRNPTKNIRELSTSNDKCSSNMKKSNSSSTKNKANLSSFGLPSSHAHTNNSSCNASMTSSIKKNRIDTSKSNKKNIMNTSSSNKSLKELRQTTNYYNKSSQVSTAKKDMMNSKQQKKGTIMVKNIKNKIVGSASGNTVTKVVKGNKQNSNNFSKKFSNLAKVQSISSQSGLNTQKSAKTPRTPRDQKMKVENLFTGVNSKINRREVDKPSDVEKKISMEDFQLGRKLGRGRFGDVYMARQTASGLALAIKVVNKKQLKQSDMQAQLLQEIKIQMFSNHPNILKMYGFFDDDKKIYLLLELATNGCLFREIRQKTYFTEQLACFYFRQVTSGIRYLHSNSVIHRDIKPENILNCFGVLKICDFGWAIYSPIYQRQTFCGTLDYVPPQIVTGQFYDEKADVWCLGVLCYELCTGKAPFESKTDENQTYDKILKVQIDFPIYLSGKVVDFIGKILNRDPQKRMNLEDVENHQWMRLHENESGRMISKQVWDHWVRLAK